MAEGCQIGIHVHLGVKEGFGYFGVTWASNKDLATWVSNKDLATWVSKKDFFHLDDRQRLRPSL